MSNFYATLFGEEFKSKKALREAVAADEPVNFADTSLFNPRGDVRADQLSPVDVIVGPNPWTKRSWYANVKNGKVI